MSSNGGISKEIWLFVVAQLITAGSVYAGIRADLREYSIRISMLEKRIEAQK